MLIPQSGTDMQKWMKGGESNQRGTEAWRRDKPIISALTKATGYQSIAA